MREKSSLLVVLLLLTQSLVWLGCSENSETTVEEVIPATPTPGEMVLIPAGEFTMGSDLGLTRPPLEAPEHTVTLPSYYIDVYEVTYGEWIRFLTESAYEPEGTWRPSYNIGKEDYPVGNVTWEDAKAYCQAAGKRLPTEAEWEKAARGTEGLKYPWGEIWESKYANTDELAMRNSVEVGDMSGDKSPFGVYDMMGNVQEWTVNELQPYPDSTIPQDANFQGGLIAVRGASHQLKGRNMSLYTRMPYTAKSQYGTGFRCVRDSEESTQEGEEGAGAENNPQSEEG